MAEEMRGRRQDRCGSHQSLPGERQKTGNITHSVCLCSRMDGSRCAGREKRRWRDSQCLAGVDRERCVGKGGVVSVGEQFNTAFAMCRQGEMCGMGRGWGCFCGRAV